jgi:hypothetical protein
VVYGFLSLIYTYKCFGSAFFLRLKDESLFLDHHQVEDVERLRSVGIYKPLYMASCFFLSCKANARVKLAKTGYGPHSSTLVVICVVRLLFVLFYELFVCKCVLPPGDKRIAVNKCNISYIPDDGNLHKHR